MVGICERVATEWRRIKVDGRRQTAGDWRRLETQGRGKRLCSARNEWPDIVKVWPLIQSAKKFSYILFKVNKWAPYFGWDAKRNLCRLEGWMDQRMSWGDEERRPSFSHLWLPLFPFSPTACFKLFSYLPTLDDIELEHPSRWFSRRRVWPSLSVTGDLMTETVVELTWCSTLYRASLKGSSQAVWNRVKSCVLFTYCWQENTIFPPHILATW